MLRKLILCVLDKRKQNKHGGVSPHSTLTAVKETVFPFKRGNWFQAGCRLTQWQWPCTTTFYYICSYLTRISQFNCRVTKVACRIKPGGRLMTHTAANGLTDEQ